MRRIMEKAYYLVKDGSIKKAALVTKSKMDEERVVLFALLKQIAIETGCNPATCLLDRGKCVGLVFDRGDPPGYLCKWRKVSKGAWWPKQTTSKGKEIVKRFEVSKPSDLNDTIPKSEAFHDLYAKGMLYVVTMVHLEPSTSSKGLFVLVTPYDEMHSDGPLLTKQEASQLKRIKPREFQVYLDMHNERI